MCQIWLDVGVHTVDMVYLYIFILLALHEYTLTFVPLQALSHKAVHTTATYPSGSIYILVVSIYLMAVSTSCWQTVNTSIQKSSVLLIHSVVLQSNDNNNNYYGCMPFVVICITTHGMLCKVQV